MSHVANIGPKGGKSKTGYFNAYGSYYLTTEQLRPLHLQ